MNPPDGGVFENCVACDVNGCDTRACTDSIPFPALCEKAYGELGEEGCVRVGKRFESSKGCSQALYTS